eukprot:scaffold17246_cov41-Phaeocystis_antarctica.AAC.2
MFITTTASSMVGPGPGSGSGLGLGIGVGPGLGLGFEQHGRAGDPLLVDLVSVGGRVGVWFRVGARVGVGVGLGVRLDHTK